MLSTSPRPRQDRPVRHVLLKIVITGTREEILKIKSVPSAVVRGLTCELMIEGEAPAEAAEKARALLGRLRAVT